MPRHPCQDSLWVQLTGKPDRAQNAKTGRESQGRKGDIVRWVRGRINQGVDTDEEKTKWELARDGISLGSGIGLLR